MVVFVKQGSLGDILMLTPSLRAFRRSFPSERIVFIVGKSNYQVLQKNPYIDELIFIDDYKIFQGRLWQKALESLKLLKTIKRYDPDEIYIFQRDWRWNFVAFLSGVKKRYGFRRDLKGLFLTHFADTTQEEHEIYKYFKVLEMKKGFEVDGVAMDVFYNKEDGQTLKNLLGKFLNSEIISIAPGGALNVSSQMDTKRWPLEYYKILLEKIFRNTDYKVLLIGDKKDKQFTSKLVLDSNTICDIAGKTTVSQTYLVLKKSKVLITHDCGPMHIGAAAGIPVISLFGPTYPVEYCPITNSNSTYIWKGKTLECSPCYKHGYFPECKHKKCMYMIEPDEVFDKALSIIR